MARRNRRKQLDAALANIRLRFGQGAISPLSDQAKRSQIDAIPTGFPKLDRLLTIGGIPRSRMTELLGAPTAGMATLAYKILAGTKQERLTYVDLPHNIDPAYAHRCGVDLSRLHVVRPKLLDAWLLIEDLVARRGSGVVVISSLDQLINDPAGLRAMNSTLKRLPALLAKSPCALIFINNLSQLPAKTDGYPLAHFASLRLLIEKEEWLVRRSDGDIAGYQAKVRVLKNKFGPERKETSIRIKFNGTVEGDGA